MNFIDMRSKFKNHKDVLSLLNTEYDNMFRYACYRIGDASDAEDVMQDLYIAISQQKDIINLKSYAYKTLSNICNEHFRKIQSRPNVDISKCPDLIVDETYPNDFDEEFILINTLLSKLPQEQSETIRLKIHCSLTFDEIALAMNVKVSTAKARFRYGIEKLRDMLKFKGTL